jgi:hypothetical protein
MTLRRSVFAILLTLAAAAQPIPNANAQAPGFADITRPSRGEALTGLVTIEGSAAHPSFVSYELAFAFEDDPTDTWFPIVDDVQTPVTDGRLGIWDTTGITDGNYVLRLLVILKSGATLEAIVEGLRVRNTTPIEAVTSAAPLIVRASPSPAVTTPAPEVIATPIPVQAGSSRVVRALTWGAIAGVFLLIALALYSLLRDRLRLRVASARSSYTHWRDDRRRGRRR